jgi:pyridoxal phosphate enzyme (YggS family)
VFDPAALRARLDDVRARISRAAGRAERAPSSIRLIAVSKTFPAEVVRAAAEAGQVDFAENKVQEALRKMDETAGLTLRWHLVGHLQTNKARQAAARFDLIHSVDSVRLLERLESAGLASRRQVDVLVQVDLAGEATKYGVAPDNLLPLVTTARHCTGVRIRGLMILPPAADDPEASRPYFVALRRLRDDLVAQGVDPAMLSELSMGMSHDFEVAVEEGATMVRVGSAIFGARSGGPR